MILDNWNWLWKSDLGTYFTTRVKFDETGVSSLGVPGVLPWHPQILADQLTLSQPGGADYAHHISTGTPEFSDLPTTLWKENQINICLSC